MILLYIVGGLLLATLAGLVAVALLEMEDDRGFGPW